ncbi:Multidrug resistance protein MdtA precursor [Roseimaritima multifibrata]|uniref:Multidrug resistance protein MdtA n=1 Tax=Roseimaritima multifibrata TaxID=1930274 RepID=A0A517MP23_9BACT|nr:efflux RND transporter periplasmic adaptor subunit [Roseimaritima multifibrata]QDS96624.1 Multidrug resistance protein MdtA precursor [Roseimaritima multifibrata]
MIDSRTRPWSLVLFSLLTCAPVVAQAQESGRSSARPERSDFVGVGTPGESKGSAPIQLEAYTQAYRDILIGSSETAVIQDVWAEEGETVKAGQTLIQLNDSVVRIAVEVARSAATAKGEIDTAKHSLADKKRRLEQVKELHSREHATDQELWNARLDLDEATARLQAYEELTHRRQLELAQAEAQLARLTIKSPIDGVVVEQVKDVGQAVSPADPHLLRIVQLDPLKIIASGNARQLGVIEVGDSLPVTIRGKTLEAVVEFVSPVVDAQSGMRHIKLRLPNPNLEYSAGIAVDVRLQPKRSSLDREQSLNQTIRQFPFLDRK